MAAGSKNQAHSTPPAHEFQYTRPMNRPKLIDKTYESGHPGHAFKHSKRRICAIQQRRSSIHAMPRRRRPCRPSCPSMDTVASAARLAIPAKHGHCGKRSVHRHAHKPPETPPVACKAEPMQPYYPHAENATCACFDALSSAGTKKGAGHNGRRLISTPPRLCLTAEIPHGQACGQVHHRPACGQAEDGHPCQNGKLCRSPAHHHRTPGASATTAVMSTSSNSTPW